MTRGGLFPALNSTHHAARTSRRASPVTNVNAPATINSNANGTDPQGMIDIAKKQIDQHWDRALRDAAAATGVKDKP